MGADFPVVLVDDGELDDVRDLLLELGIEFAHLRGGAVPRRLDAPRDLFIATLRHAGLARRWPMSTDGSLRPLRIAVVTEDSTTARSSLRRFGFGYLVRRPVHPVALRLLLLRALYRGDERRAEPRVPVGVDVAFRSGLRRRDALLADLSRGGCRLLTDRALPAGARLSIHLPEELLGGEALSLAARVVRCERDAEPLLDGGFSVAVQFEPVSAAERKRIDRALASRSFATAGEEPARVVAMRSEAPIEGGATTRPGGTPVARRTAEPARPEPAKRQTAKPEPQPAAPVHEHNALDLEAVPPAQAAPQSGSMPIAVAREPGEPLSRPGPEIANAPVEDLSELATPEPSEPDDTGSLEAAASSLGPRVPEPRPTAASKPGPRQAPAEPGPRLAKELVGRRRGPPPERRRHKRGVYDRRVIAQATAAMHRMLLGRDVAAGGMRVEPHPDLRVGSRLRLALYDASRQAPLVLDAVVSRDDGKRGLALQFLGIGPELAARIEHLIAALPPVERLTDGEAESVGTVVSEIVSHSRDTAHH